MEFVDCCSFGNPTPMPDSLLDFMVQACFQYTQPAIVHLAVTDLGMANESFATKHESCQVDVETHFDLHFRIQTRTLQMRVHLLQEYSANLTCKLYCECYSYRST